MYYAREPLCIFWLRLFIEELGFLPRAWCFVQFVPILVFLPILVLIFIYEAIKEERYN